VLLLVDDPPAQGLVVAHVDLTEAARWCDIDAVAPEGIRARAAKDDHPVPLQFVPDDGFDGRQRIAGTVVMRLPEQGDQRVRLAFSSAEPVSAETWDGTATTSAFTVEHDPNKLGGLPWQITFGASGKIFEGFRWNDRVYDRTLGWFGLCNDPEAQVQRISQGPLATVIRVRARYLSSEGRVPASQPWAIYDWYYFHDRPLVFVRAEMYQRESFAWPEHHFLELNYAQEAFAHWAGGEPLKQGEFTASKESLRFTKWGAVTDDTNAIAMFDCGQALLYDGGSGTYLHAHGDAAWSPWRDERRAYSAWLWMGDGHDLIAAIRDAAAESLSSARVVVTVPQVRARIEAARLSASTSSGRGNAAWHAAMAEQLEAEGRLAEARDVADGKRPTGSVRVRAGDLGFVVEPTGKGVRLRSLFDLKAARELLASDPPPLFEATLRHAETKEEVQLTADAGWQSIRFLDPERPGLWLECRDPEDDRLAGVWVAARADHSTPSDVLRWTLDVHTKGTPWSVWQVTFPQTAVAELGEDARVFVPRGAGEVQAGVWRRPFQFSGRYPSGWTSMPFLAAYDRDGSTGLYFAMHDGQASTREVRVASRPADRALVLAFEHPAPDMGVAGNDFHLGGEAVMQLLRGDWFDAATTYRHFVRERAAWWPKLKLSAEGREDTPLWMRELSCWALSGGAPKDCVQAVKEFQKYLGVPVGFHWYNWHQIPFDNDYPHYFPTKEGFADAVRDLQASNVHVMPYINGRLWDTRDKGMEDFEFTSIARAAASKDDSGEPYTEMYGSKETDGSRVKLAAMCPTTDVWKSKVREIVLRLVNECGVKGVYIDQVAAAKPRLCFDASHGHPLGGGHWWTAAYWDLMRRIHQEMPDDRMLTTECNAEAYAHRFDGYLTWHWQYDGQVPAFPAVYGGAIQMFGRAYRGGPTKNLALRMKAGQQLVYGEQIGWINPGVVNEKDNAEFLRRVVRLRDRLRRYFYAGEMARPPKLIGEIPDVTADWQWSGEWPVTTKAVMTGAWILPREHRGVVLVVNVGDEPVTARLDFNAATFGLDATKLSVTKHTTGGSEQTAGPDPEQELTFPPRTAWAWEFNEAQEEGADLKMSIRTSNAESADSLRVDVAFENLSDRDTVLNLGMMLANGRVQLPDAVRLILTDSGGRSRELHFSDKRYPGVAGRVDDYAVPLRAGSTYTLRLSLKDYWCPESEEFALELDPGRYSVRAEFTGNSAQHLNEDTEGLKFLPFWTGKLRSGVAHFHILTESR
jgi:hypothetical protein